MASPILLGDSIFKRLYAQNSGLFDPLSKTLCVSGQKVSDLYSLVRAHRDALKGRKLYLLIGTNDILQSTSHHQLMLSLRTLLRYLGRQRCEVHLCELPPIPRLGRKASASEGITKINQFIRSFEPGGKVRVVRLFALFCMGDYISSHLFENFIGPRRRTDLVHPNRDGLQIILLSLEGV